MNDSKVIKHYFRGVIMRAFACRLPDWATKEIEKIAQEKELAFATAVRCIVVDHLKENAPAENPTKTAAGTASHKPLKECASI